MGDLKTPKGHFKINSALGLTKLLIVVIIDSALTQHSKSESGDSVRFIEKSNLRQQNDDQKKIATYETASVFESFEQNEQKAILLYCLISCIFDSTHKVTCFLTKSPKH